MRVSALWIAVLLVSVLLCGCGSPSSSQNSSSSSVAQLKVTLNWEESSDVAVVGYNIYRSNVSGGPYGKLDSTLDARNTYTDTTVQPGETYYYVLTAVDYAGVESSYSAQVIVTVPSS